MPIDHPDKVPYMALSILVESCQFLANRLRAERLRSNISQERLAAKAGVALRTYKRIERTGTGSIENLILVLEALGRRKAIEFLLPPPAPGTEPLTTRIERIRKHA